MAGLPGSSGRPPPEDPTERIGRPLVINTHERSQFSVEQPPPLPGPGEQVPPPFVPPDLLKGVFAHTVRTYVEGGIICIDFGYQAPVNWHFTGSGSRVDYEHVVTARVLMPWPDFATWIERNARILGYMKAEEMERDASAD
ncbi:MAG: hypothetical protein M3176_14440 [Chloroflexota bacterium]|nr:hypothetical protein [Chloroflexota bacterium]